MLSDVDIRNAKSKDKPYKMTDDRGMYVLITPTGGKLWRYDYRFGGKRKTLALGIYPDVSLKRARERLQEARQLLANDADPSDVKKAAKAAVKADVENTFEIIAREWFTKNKGAWAPSHSSKIMARLQNDLFPIVGGKSIHVVTASDLLEALRHIEARGAIETAHRALQDCGQIFRYAIATGRAGHNIAADLKGALQPVKKQNFASIKEPKAIGVLLRDIDTYDGNVIVRFALRMVPYVFVRPGELRCAEWSEFDFDKAEWRIPAEKMKMRQVHIVPLARQVVAILEDLRQYTGNGW